MSVTELQSEIAKLSPAELEALRSTIESELTRKQASAQRTWRITSVACAAPSPSFLAGTNPSLWKTGTRSTMTYLFDTNAWLRAIERPEDLSSSARSAIYAAQDVPFGLSAISIYEVGQKVRRGKLQLSIPLDRWLLSALRAGFVRVVPIDADIARGANELPGYFPSDPADRLTVATARKHGLTVLTSDLQILAYSGAQTIW